MTDLIIQAGPRFIITILSPFDSDDVRPPDDIPDGALTGSDGFILTGADGAILTGIDNG